MITSYSTCLYIQNFYLIISQDLRLSYLSILFYFRYLLYYSGDSSLKFLKNDRLEK